MLAFGIYAALENDVGGRMTDRLGSAPRCATLRVMRTPQRIMNAGSFACHVVIGVFRSLPWRYFVTLT
jgi:hypothetical protein